MKTKFTITALFLLSTIILFGEVIEKNYRFSHPAIAQSGDYQTIRFEGTLLTGLPGEPALPWFAVSLILPPGHSASGVEIITGREVLLPGNFQILPMQNVQPLSKGGSGTFVKNETVYNQHADYPTRIHGELSTQYLNGFSVAMVNFTPLKYNPATGKITYFQDITVRIRTAPDVKSSGALANINQSPTNLAILKKIAQNHGMIAAYPQNARSSDDYQMLIVTPAQFAASFASLINFYLPRGIQARVATTESIYSTMPGLDNPEKIRNYIIQEYQNHGIEHVTLAGDVEYVPYRGFYCWVQSSSLYEDSNIPSDLYFAALDGNWNTDGDALWGEIGEDDLLPEIGVARMSFSSLAELNILITKTISYQGQPVTGELRNPLLAGEYLYGDPLTWGADYLDMILGFKDDNGYETTGIPLYHNIDSLYDRNQTWNKATLIQEMNQGHSFIHHVGHANATYAMRMSNSDITNTNFSQLNGTTHNYTLIFSHGCICGAFDNNDCIAERMININNLAVAVMMNSRYGWFNEGQTEGPACHLHREFCDALYDKKESLIGQAYRITRIETAPWVNAPGQWEQGALRWNFYDLNVLGDAALRIWTDEPVSIGVDYDPTITTENTGISVEIHRSKVPMVGLVCVFMMNDTVFGKAITDENGIADIVFDIPLTNSGDASIYVSGYNCPLHEYPVTVEPAFHFEPVWSTAFNPMIFYVVKATLDDVYLVAGDEIGIYDIDPNTNNEICVGAGTVTGTITPANYLEITASMDDGSLPGQANGFTAGHIFIFKIYSQNEGLIETVNYNFPYPGYDQVFTALGTAIVEIQGTIQTPGNHSISLSSGWQGISSYFVPTNTNIQSLTAEIEGQLESIQNLTSFYEPGNGSSTLTNWNYQSGYFIKLSGSATLEIPGSVPANKTISLTTGWNLIPVLSECPVGINTLFGAEITNCEIIKDAVGLNVYWPSRGVSTLNLLIPGHSYLVKVSQNLQVTFPECQ